MAVQQVTFAYIDSGGNYATTQFMSQTSGIGVNIFMKENSNASVIWDTVAARDYTYVSEGSNALFPSVRQWASLMFETASGGRVSLLIPAPLSGMFMADNLTIDPDSLIVAPLILNCITGGALTTPTGDNAVEFIGGNLIGRGGY